MNRAEREQIEQITERLADLRDRAPQTAVYRAGGATASVALQLQSVIAELKDMADIVDTAEEPDEQPSTE